MIQYSKKLASQYNNFHYLPDNFLKLQVQKILLYLNVQDDVVLDVGCGAGRLLVPMSEHTKMIGCEKSIEMYNQIPKHLQSQVTNADFKEFIQSAPAFDLAYFSFSLHQIGSNKLDQCHILQNTLDHCRGKVLVISVSEEQFSEITINQLFPSINDIDRERYLFKNTIKNFFNLEMMEQQTIYSKIPKTVLSNMIENNYISTLQLISTEEKEEGLLKLKSTPGTTFDYCDCFTYYLISSK